MSSGLAKKKETYLMLPYNSEIKSFVAKNIGKIQSDSIPKYWNFFYGLTLGGFDHCYLIEYPSNNKNTKLVFDDIKGFNHHGLFSAATNIFYNPLGHYFEIACEVASGWVVRNSDGLTNFNTLLNGSTLYLKLRYIGDRKNTLPKTKKSSKSVFIERIEIGEVSQVRYGNSLQYFLVLPPNSTSNLYDRGLISELYDEAIGDTEGWRYCVLKVPLKKL
jgi:hypothetical protein